MAIVKLIKEAAAVEVKPAEKKAEAVEAPAEK
jgi:hypothetical protein